MQQAITGRPITGRHVLLAMIAFFAVIFAVNGVFLYSALSTHTGVVAVEPYRKGVAYNERIAADEQQQSLGWQIDLSVPEKDGDVSVKLVDRDGRAQTGLNLTGRIGRPTTGAHDQPLEFREQAGGRYTASVAALEGGTWIIELQASELKSGGEEVVWRMRKRLWQKP